MSEKLKADFARWRKDPRKFVRELFGVTPDAWQDDVLEAFPHHQRIAMLASKGPGKAQPKATIIETPYGKRRFGDLREGDFVFAGDGSRTRVVAIYDRGMLPIFRVAFDDDSSTLACGEHLWKVRGEIERRHDTWSILSTDEIVQRGVRVKNGRWAGRQFEVPRQGPAQYPIMNLRLDPYVMGVWLGDGVRRKSAYATKPTDEISQEIRRRGYETSTPRDGLVTVYGIYDALRSYGVFDLHSHDRFVPDEFMEASVSQRWDLICGLMDTDGGIDVDGHMEFSSTSKRLAENVVWLARSVGGTAFIKKSIKKPFYYGKDRKKIFGKDCYRVTVRLPFNPFLVPHRRNRWTDPHRSPSTLRYMTRKIDRIDPAGAADCMCIEVEDPEGLYLTNDFIVTHNTALEAWLVWNFMLTRPDPNIAVTAIDGNNLASNLWKELAKWQERSPLLKAFFTQSSTKIEAKHKPKVWWCQARTWPKKANPTEMANTLAGLHQEYVMFVLDESGAMPESILASAENALSTCIEGHILQAGNPTHLEGPLYHAHKNRDMWLVIQINGDPDNPKRSPRVSVDWARQQIKLYGRDNPWVKVNVFGEFPSSSINALIGPEEIEEAQRRFYQQHELNGFAKILGVDVARQGDDASVIVLRQGRQMFNLRRYRGLDNTQGGNQLNRVWGEVGADAAFIDGTGGFGMGWHDKVKELGRSPIPVMFNAKATMDGRYANKRAEMYFEFVDWIKNGGALPPVNSEGAFELAKSLAETTYSFKGDRMMLEEKEQIRIKLGFSPDEADACFVAGTMVETPTGPRPIEAILPGDEVLTPFGTTRVAKRWVLQSDRVTTVQFSNGRSLTGTPDHEIFVFSHGKVDLDALTLTMEVSPWEKRSDWLRMSAWFTGGPSIGFKRAAGILAPGSQSSVSVFCIAASGLKVMGQFRMAWSCITRTMIGAIARSTIWRSSLLASTPVITWPNTMSAPAFAPSMRLTWQEDARARLSGIDLMRVENGTVNTDARHGKTGSRESSNAPDVESHLKASCSKKMVRGFAPVRVLKRWLSSAISLMRGSVRGAAAALLQTDTDRHSVVPVRVVTESAPQTAVYNLTLERDNAYYANGILVFNCALTFAEPVTVSRRQLMAPSRSAVSPVYNPYSDMSLGMTPQGDYSPYRYD